MKTTLSILLLVVFSAIMLTPTLPKAYPPKEVIQQRKEIKHKEIQLECLITDIECRLEKDSINIANSKR